MNKLKEEIDDRQSFYYLIPASIIEEGELTKGAIYGLIYSLCNKKGYCYASNRYLAEKLRMKSLSTISGHVAQLQKEGWITAEVNRDAGNKRRIWIEIGPTGKQRGLMLENNSSYVQTKEGSYVQTKESNKKKSNKKESTDSEQSSETPHSRIVTSSVEEAQKKGVSRKIKDAAQLDILQVFQRYINSTCTDMTKGAVEGIPRALKIFKGAYNEEAVPKLKEALVALAKVPWYQGLRNKNPYLGLAGTIFKQGFIEKHLIALSSNPQTHGTLRDSAPTEEELRQIAENNKRNIEKFMERRRK